MSVHSLLPWTARFNGLHDEALIKQRVRLAAKPIDGLQAIPPRMATEILSSALSDVYYPTSNDCSILSAQVQRMIAHTLRAYPSVIEFQRRAYSTEHPAEHVVPCLLTGPSRVGKSQLIKALGRLLPPPADYYISESLPKLQLTAYRKLIVESRLTTNAVLAALAYPQAKRSGDPVNSTRRSLYVAGVSLIVADELQFVTLSQNANATASRIVLTIGYLGIPCIVVANYRLVNLLWDRFVEDRNRMLIDPLLMLPEQRDGVEWYALIDELLQVSRASFAFSAAEAGPLLHRYTFGLRGCLRKLLAQSYSISREAGRPAVTLSDIESAYASVCYTSMREDVEEHWRIAAGIPSKRSDLRCPLLVADPSQADLARRARSEQIGNAVVADSLTRGERAAYEAASKPTKAGVPIKRRRAAARASVDKEALARGIAGLSKES